MMEAEIQPEFMTTNPGLLCPICSRIPVCPVQVKDGCSHVFCPKCLNVDDAVLLQCPLDKTPITFDTDDGYWVRAEIVHPPKPFMAIFESLKILCKYK